MLITETFKSIASLTGIQLAELGTHVHLWVEPDLFAELRLKSGEAEMRWALYDTEVGLTFHGVATIDAQGEEVAFRDENAHTSFLQFCEAVRVAAGTRG